jgi:hypothetical protein
MNSWLESLQGLHKMAPPPTKAAATDPLLDAILGSANDDTSVAIAERVLSIFDETGDANVPEPVGAFLKAESDERNRIPQFAPDESHADGEEMEKIGSAVWTRTYANGQVVKSMTNDPTLPGRQCFFDARGFEISRAEYLALDRATAPDLLIENSLAKIIGADESSQHPEESCR